MYAGSYGRGVSIPAYGCISPALCLQNGPSCAACLHYHNQQHRRRNAHLAGPTTGVKSPSTPTTTTSTTTAVAIPATAGSGYQLQHSGAGRRHASPPLLHVGGHASAGYGPLSMLPSTSPNRLKLTNFPPTYEPAPYGGLPTRSPGRHCALESWSPRTNSSSSRSQGGASGGAVKSPAATTTVTYEYRDGGAYHSNYAWSSTPDGAYAYGAFAESWDAVPPRDTQARGRSHSYEPPRSSAASSTAAEQSLRARAKSDITTPTSKEAEEEEKKNAQEVEQGDDMFINGLSIAVETPSLPVARRIE